MTKLLDIDPDVATAMKNEAERQRRNVVLIASENYSSAAVLEAMGSHLTNKYAEGCLLYTSPSPRDGLLSRMPSSA